MTNFIKKQIAILVSLQDLDNQTQRLQASLNEVAGQLEGLDRQLEASEQAFRAKEQGLENLRKTYRDSDRDVQSLRAKISRSQEKTGSVKTNKEYQSLLKEIDDLKVKASQIEDDMLEILEKIEVEEERCSEQKKELAALKKDVEEQKHNIEAESDSKKKRLEGLLEQRKTIVNDIAPDMLLRFEKVRDKVGLLTIAAVRDYVCKGCHLNIPPQFFNELQRCETLLQCPNCQRIIYFSDPKKRSE